MPSASIRRSWRASTGSREVIAGAVARCDEIYGVTTLFGGMADLHVTRDQLIDGQRIALWNPFGWRRERSAEIDAEAERMIPETGAVWAVRAAHARYGDAGRCPSGSTTTT